MPEADYCRLKDVVAASDNIYLTQNRIHGVLDTRSLVDIVFEMVHTAQQRDSYQYYCLLSGQDYPIKPMDFIIRQLDSNYPTPYLDCGDYGRDCWLYHKFSYNPVAKKLFDVKLKHFPSRKSLGRIVLGGLGRVAIKVGDLLKISDYHKFTRQNVTLYGGSAWWILPDTAIAFIDAQYREQTPLVTALLNTYTPEETFFQIMAMRSPIRDQIEIRTWDREQNCKTWAYFSDEGKPRTGHPYIFTAAEFEKLKRSDRWFARKFDRTVDSRIFDLLDEHTENWSAADGQA